MEKTNEENYPLHFPKSADIEPEPTYTADEYEKLGPLGVKAKEKARRDKINFEGLFNAYWEIKQKTIGAGGLYRTPKTLAEVKTILPNLSNGQLEAEKENYQIEIQNIDEMETILNTAVFSDRVKQDFEKTGVVTVCFSHGGNDRIEPLRGKQYENLAAFTNEDFGILAEARAHFTECEKIDADELAARETRTPGELRTFQKDAKDLIHAGMKVTKELEKIAAKFDRARTPENRAEFRQLWDKYHELEAKYTSVRAKINALNSQAEVVEFPQLSHDVRYTHDSVGKLGLK